MAIKMTMADGTVIEGTAEELAKLQELAGIKEESEEPTIEYDKPAQVGDKVRLLSGGNKHPLFGFNNGGVYEVTDVNYDHGDIDGKAVAIKREDGHTGYAHPSQIEKVSEADLVFIENGREPGEYKVGDIVAYDDPEWFRNSGIGEVIGCSGDPRLPRVRAVDYEGDVVTYYLDHEIKPIAFVEKRVDKIV